MHFKNDISKVATLIVAALLFFSFTSSYVLSARDWGRIEKSTKALFNTDDFSFSEINTISKFGATRLFKIDDLGYLAFDQAPSKFHKFEYYMIFSDKGDVLKIEVLNYNENYGAEICNKRWLKQFQKINTSSFLTYNNSIDGISGATLSVQSISANSWQVTQKLKTHLQLK
jgi:hypothetical protein